MPHRIHPLLEERTAGVLLHPTSLPGARGTAGVGDLGPAARKFCDWMHRAGLKRWQMLPIGPVGAGDSALQRAFKLCDRAHAGFAGRLGFRRVAARLGPSTIRRSEEG